jgi:hypothetical protein
MAAANLFGNGAQRPALVSQAPCQLPLFVGQMGSQLDLLG